MKNPVSFVNALSKADPDAIKNVISLLDALSTESLEAHEELQTHQNSAIDDLNAANAAVDSTANDLVQTENAVRDAQGALQDAQDAVQHAEAAHDAANSQKDIAQTNKDDADANLEEQGPVLQNEYTVIQDVIRQLQALIPSEACSSYDAGHHVVYNGYVYRTITLFEVNSVSVLCEREWNEMPDGWNLSPDSSDIIENVVRPFPWSTHVVQFENMAYHGSNYHEDISHWAMAIDGNSYKVYGCSAVVLIRRACHV